MPPRFFFFIPGILTRWRDYGWHDRAVDWVTKNVPPPTHCDKYEYWADFITCEIGQDQRIQQVAQTLRNSREFEPSDEVIVAAHSNGAAIILGALLENPDVWVQTLHLFAPAADCDCRKNGLNTILHRAQVQQVYVYGSEEDRALEVAGGIGTWFGFGNLGLAGLHELDGDLMPRVHSEWREYGHGTWFDYEHFDETMAMVTRRDGVG